VGTFNPEFSPQQGALQPHQPVERAKNEGEPELYTVTFRPLPGTDGIRALRGTLKVALRRFRLRCIDARRGGRT
jgi:hypothetical protein